MQADGKTVVYHIPDGTGGKDWDSKDDPIKVRRGMVLHLVDDDQSTRSGGHWLHTNGQRCPHGLKAIGTGFDGNISMSAPMGIVPGVFGTTSPTASVSSTSRSSPTDARAHTPLLHVVRGVGVAGADARERRARIWRSVSLQRSCRCRRRRWSMVHRLAARRLRL